jgi:hypothetical protein
MRQQFALWPLGNVKDRLKSVHQRRNMMISARWCTAFRRSSAIMRIAGYERVISLPNCLLCYKDD